MPLLKLGDTAVEVIRKDIKNVHLSVLPPTGAVRIAAPRRMKLEAIRLFAISKLPWIRQHQKKMQGQERESPRDYVDRESHYVWGKRYLLKLVPSGARPAVVLKHKTLELHARDSLPAKQRAALLDAWYREQIRAVLPLILEKWQRLLRVEVNRTFVQRMKTKWGSANPQRGSIRLNTDLARKPAECLEYVVLHELSHFLSARHDARFVALLDQHLPHWRAIREQLNAAPLRYEKWA